MEYRDILTGEMQNVDPEKRVSKEDLQKEVEDLKVIVAQLLEEKGV
jgi:hypothetical protein